MSINVAKNKAVYHNPKRQRGIRYHAAKTESLTHVSGCDSGKIAISELAFRVCKTQETGKNCRSSALTAIFGGFRDDSVATIPDYGVSRAAHLDHEASH